MSAERKPVSSRPAPPAPTRWQVGALRTSVQILLAVCVLVAALWVIHRIQGVLLVLALSVLFAYLVAPVVAFFTRPVTLLGAPRAMPATLAIVAAYLAIFGTLAGAVALVLPVLNAQFADFRAELAGIRPPVRGGLAGLVEGPDADVAAGHAGGHRGDRRPGVGGVVALRAGRLPAAGRRLADESSVAHPRADLRVLSPEGCRPVAARGARALPGAPAALAGRRLLRGREPDPGRIHPRAAAGLPRRRDPVHGRLPVDRPAVRRRSRDCGRSAGAASPRGAAHDRDRSRLRSEGSSRFRVP